MLNNILKNKIDFLVLIEVNNANPNGDPSLENEPRTNLDGYGEISAECIKRKIRNRLQDEGETILIQSPEKNGFDGAGSIKTRVENAFVQAKKDKKDLSNIDSQAELLLEKYIDVRTFGAVIAYKNNKKEKGSEGVSIGIRGPVTIRQTVSADPVNITEMGIVKSVNGEDTENGKKDSSTMGKRYFVDYGLYSIAGSINPYLSDRTHFTVEDAEKIKEALKTLFVNDSSSARPEGSMTVLKVFWWEHEGSKSGYYPTKVIHDSVKIAKKENVRTPKTTSDYVISLDNSYMDDSVTKVSCQTYGPLKLDDNV